MSETITRFPLQWPAGWRRTPSFEQRRAQFNGGRRELGGVHRVTVLQGYERVLEQLRHLDADENDIVVSTNIRTRLDGMPRSDQGEPVDKGAAVYWRTEGGKQAKCMAIDLYDRVADNLAAIAATLESIRAIERHGGGAILDRVFEGFVALPAPEQWWQVLGIAMDASREEIIAAHRRIIAAHPDFRTGGSASELARVNVARDAGLEARR